MFFPAITIHIRCDVMVHVDCLDDLRQPIMKRTLSVSGSLGKLWIFLASGSSMCEWISGKRSVCLLYKLWCLHPYILLSWYCSLFPLYKSTPNSYLWDFWGSLSEYVFGGSGWHHLEMEIWCGWTQLIPVNPWVILGSHEQLYHHGNRWHN